ncbi:uncharacterized protein LOC109723580 isoform X1 [Ananas comosus]|uniref:Uncharacterized protein LOC109723580 isoform X1 n=1 Tax=Ananas comosus TaxID=4615 RepID=A0A6P5GIJ6_ANACO|nr:uncharacterized protein LOC109723580 isoform X1 [Ananas comosus]
MSSGTLALAHSPFRSRSLLLLLLPGNPSPRSFAPNGFSLQRIRLFRSYCSSPTHSLDLPLLPFELGEVLIPSECKTLHLYEARFLALLEESLLRRKKTFVHFVLDPVRMSRSSNRASFTASYGCLVHIENVDKLEIGALVSIRGMSRVNIVKLVHMEPYLRGTVVPMLDNTPYQENELDLKLSELRDFMRSLHRLQMKLKLKAPEEELLQTHIKSSLIWAENAIYEDCNQAFIPKLAERLSFAAFQPVSGMSDSEFLALQREKLQAMNSRDTLERLHGGIEYVKQNINMVAARLAIQSLAT